LQCSLGLLYNRDMNSKQERIANLTISRHRGLVIAGRDARARVVLDTIFANAIKGHEASNKYLKEIGAI
jgi:hypothetical protein